MDRQIANSGLATQAIGQYFSYRLLVIPAVALLMMMTTFVSLRSHRIYPGAARDPEINLGQGQLETDAQEDTDLTFATLDTNMPRGDGRQQPVSGYTVQENDEEVEVTGTQEGYSNVSAMTGFHVDWGAENNRLLFALLTHMKKAGPEFRGLSLAGHLVPVAAAG